MTILVVAAFITLFSTINLLQSENGISMSETYSYRKLATTDGDIGLSNGMLF